MGEFGAFPLLWRPRNRRKRTELSSAVAFVPTIAARELARHSPPPGVELDPASAQAIHDELDRRKRAGLRAGMALYALTVAALHPMYVPDRLSGAAAMIALALALFGGFTIGETYAAVAAVRRPRTSRRVAGLAPRSAATYLSPPQRLLQAGLLVATAAATVALAGLTLTRDAGWTAPALLGATVWLAGICASLVCQRLVLAAPVPLEGAGRLVREFPVASTMQVLHRSTWGLGGLIYLASAAIILGPAPDFGPLAAAYLPPLAVGAVVHGVRRLLDRPDPLWHFAHISESPV